MDWDDFGGRMVQAVFGFLFGGCLGLASVLLPWSGPLLFPGAFFVVPGLVFAAIAFVWQDRFWQLLGSLWETARHALFWWI